MRKIVLQNSEILSGMYNRSQSKWIPTSRWPASNPTSNNVWSKTYWNLEYDVFKEVLTEVASRIGNRIESSDG